MTECWNTASSAVITRRVYLIASAGAKRRLGNPDKALLLPMLALYPLFAVLPGVKGAWEGVLPAAAEMVLEAASGICTIAGNSEVRLTVYVAGVVPAIPKLRPMVAEYMLAS